MILKYKSKSNSKQAVRALGLLLGLGTIDIYSAELRDAVRAFQKEHQLTADGIAGPKTLKALVDILPEVRYGDRSGNMPGGVDICAVQALVSTAIDGIYGKNTRANVTAFQAASGIDISGNVDKNTWLALWDLPYIRSSKPIDISETSSKSKVKIVQPVDYKQYDSRWGGITYTSVGNKSQTIRNSGCGPTSMADILATWEDKKITPVTTAKFALEHGYRTPSNGTDWGFYKAIAKAYGYSSRFVQTKSMATARNALREGAYVVASMAPGYWTKGGHFICLWKTDDTYMYANDPASSVRKKQKLGPFEEQRKQFFIFYRK